VPPARPEKMRTSPSKAAAVAQAWVRAAARLFPGQIVHPRATATTSGTPAPRPRRKEGRRDPHGGIKRQAAQADHRQSLAQGLRPSHRRGVNPWGGRRNRS
jgi:hypothetical protein